MSHPNTKFTFSRRDFLKTTAAAGAGLVLAPVILGEEAKVASKTINVAFIGVGTEGRVLLENNCLKMKSHNLRYVAIADIWPYNRDRVVRLLKKYGHPANGYTDFQEMLEKEKELDAVIIASPDFVHAEHTIGCLKAGKHVYCEKEMSNSLELAKQMVVTAKETKKLLQIGHQRRSNPRYQVALEYMQKKKAIGRPTFVSAHWNRSKRLDVGTPKGYELDDATLKKYGYDTMQRFRNWRWYKKFSGGPIADLGSHQIDIFNWVLNASPRAVMATGGLDYYEGIEWYDNISALYEWDAEWEGKKIIVRGFYQVLSTTSHGGYAETFMGDQGSLVISEQATIGGIRREQEAPEADWEKELQKALPKKPEAAKPAEPTPAEGDAAAAKPAAKKDEEEGVAHSVPAPGRYYPPISAPYPQPKDAPPSKPEHMPHLENFFDAVLNGTALTCPGEVGYDTAVTVLKVNEAVATGKRLEYTPAEFKA